MDLSWIVISFALAIGVFITFECIQFINITNHTCNSKSAKIAIQIATALVLAIILSAEIFFVKHIVNLLGGQ